MRLTLKNHIELLEDKFLANLLLERSTPSRLELIYNLNGEIHLIIDHAFLWHFSPEGKLFWKNVALQYKLEGKSDLIEELRVAKCGFSFKKGDKIVMPASNCYFFNDEEDEIDEFPIRKSILIVEKCVSYKKETYVLCHGQKGKVYFKIEQFEKAKLFNNKT